MKPYVHKVNYYETDKMGLTHHSNYIRFMEEARVYILEQLGWGYDRMEAEGIISPVVNVECNFKKSTTFPDELKVYVSIEKLAAFKLTFKYEMKKGDDVVFTATSSHCFLDSTGRPIVIEKKYPELFNILSSGIEYEG